MSRPTRFTLIDDDPLLFEVPADWLVADTRMSLSKPEKSEGEGVGLLSLLERPHMISRKWLARERRAPRRVNVPRRRPRSAPRAG